MSQSALPQSSISSNDSQKSWFSLREAPAWGVSLTLHTVILGAFAFYSLPIIREQLQELVVSEVEETFDPEFKFDVATTDQIGNNGTGDTLSPSLAAAGQLSPSPQQETSKRLQEELVKVNVAPTASIGDVATDALAKAVEVRGGTENLSNAFGGNNGTGGGSGGTAGTIDRLTFEIMSSLKERKTLVVWLFDESISMQKRRKDVADRFENIYKQLGLLNIETKDALKSGIVSFGKDFHFISKDATDDIQLLVKLVNEHIPNDESGRENVFAAVEASVKKYKEHRTRDHRNCLLVVVTDERGDDFDKLDSSIQAASSAGFKVFCVGNAAPFGQEKGYVMHTYEDGFSEELPVDQGPETVYPEYVNLPYFGVPSGDLTRMTAGLGPYALTRLCAETQGIYLITDEMRGVKFDPAVMRNYLPDYRPIKFYVKDVQSNRAKSVLVDAAKKTFGESTPIPETVFRADNDNTLRQQLNEAQKPFAILDYKLNDIASVLEQGEKDRAKIKEPRWQAAYDCAYGRVLAMRVRAAGYNMMLAQMKGTPKTFEKQGNNTWELIASDEITTGVNYRKMAQKAQEHLERCVNQHQGTPWAKLAERELSKPMGWSWKELHRDYEARERAMAAAAKRGPLFIDEEEKKKEEMRKKAAARVKPNL